MADPTLLHSLTLEGFRAYLRSKTFDFSKKPCLAIFAPNGLGKSSVIDALEFLFSDNGTLDRLGQRTLNNQAGPAALAQNGAQTVGIAPVIKFSTNTGKVIADGDRKASGNQRPIHAAAAAMKAGFVVAPIIRGYTLRTFVEEHKSENRYSDVVGWLQLSPLVEVQKNLRLLRREIKAAAESTTEQLRLAGLLRAETDQTVLAWEDGAVIDFVNAIIIAPLDPGLALATLDVTDVGYVEVGKRVEAEEKRVGLADAHAAEADERGKAGGTVFRSVWKEAEKLFAEGAPDLDACPVCATAIGDTAAGSMPAIRDLLKAHLGDLESYNDAKTSLDAAEATATQAHSRLVARLPGMINHLSDDEPDGFKAAFIAYHAGIVEWPAADNPDVATITAELEVLLIGLDQEIVGIEEKQGEHTWVKAKASIDRLLKIRTEVALATRNAETLSALHDALGTQAALVSGKIREKVQSLLDTLQGPMNDIYKEIQGENARPIRLELPAEDDTNQQRMQLVIDFADDRQSVAPGGYLSDSQIHSVALALRLAAIKKFNGAAPLIALDDVVTSYDADHRRAIGALLAKMLTDCQIILVTHDERFFNHLKDQLAAKDGQFMRIIGLDPAFGPRFADHEVTDGMIVDRWVRGSRQPTK
ncbi:AAA family ATPase [Pseudochrobactrum asaccharolyticum]|nr:AAA family ATPase [Pseudochrobactrum asaccharolyticum]